MFYGCPVAMAKSNVQIIQRSVQGFNFCCHFALKPQNMKISISQQKSPEMRKLGHFVSFNFKIKGLYFVERDMAKFCFRGPCDSYFTIENKGIGHI